MLEQALRDLVRAGRAARAALLRGRLEHEVTDDELAPPLAQVEQAGLAVGTGEHVVLLDLDHGQPAAIGVERVAAPGQLISRITQLQPFPERLKRDLVVDVVVGLPVSPDLET